MKKTSITGSLIAHYLLIEGIRSVKEAKLKQIQEKYDAKKEELRFQGAHRSLLDNVSLEQSREEGNVRGEAREKLIQFPLHKILASTEYKLFPVECSEHEWVLFQTSATEAILLENRCVWRQTSYQLRVLGCDYACVCACRNCFRERGSLAPFEKILDAVGQVATAAGIHNVILRHCDGWPGGVARSKGIQLWEIGSEKNRGVLGSIAEKLEELVAQELAAARQHCSNRNK